MNIENLSKAIDLRDQLKIAIAHHNENLKLTEKRGGRFNLPPTAYITLGGDCYGNGSMHRIEVKIADSPDLVRECRKIQSKSWSLVVSIRSELRELGVTIDANEA